MRLPFWLLRLLPMWEYICPKCRKTVKKSSHECPHCGERFPLAIRVPPSFLKDPKKLEAYVHKHVFPRVSAFERAYLTKYFTVLFSDGFETNDFSAWTATSGSIAVVSTYAHHGTYSACCTAYGYCYKTLAASQADAYFRAYVMWKVAPASGQSPRVMMWRDTGSSDLSLYYENVSGTLRFRLQSEVGGAVGTYDVTVTLGQWYCLEIRRKTGTTTGVATFYLDGVSQISNSAFNTGTNNNNTAFLISDNYTNAQIYYDCVVVADAYIGPEEEVTLKTVTDSFSLSESVLRNKTLILSDSLGLADSLYGNKSLLLSDSASLSELVTVIIGEVMKYVTDSVSSADLVSTPSRVLRALEAIGATDNAAVNKVLQITETLSLAEIVEVGVGGVKKTKLFLILGDLAVQLTGD